MSSDVIHFLLLLLSALLSRGSEDPVQQRLLEPALPRPQSFLWLGRGGPPGRVFSVPVPSTRLVCREFGRDGFCPWADLEHAVIAAEDAHFNQHHGFDWHAIQITAEDDLEGDRPRGASTITQQLVRKPFLGTGRSILRKGAEVTLVPVAEFVLGK